MNALCQDDLKTRPEVLNGWLNTTSKDEGLAKTREGMLNGSVNANQKYVRSFYISTKYMLFTISHFNFCCNYIFIISFIM